MSETSKSVTAALIIIGNEILSGRTQDANLAYLANWLNLQGVQMQEARVVADDPDAIIEAVNALRHANDYVFTTGGIGPTHDDITVECVAAAFDLPVVTDERALAMLVAHYGEDKLTDARRRMARAPEGGELINNSVSGAPGIRINNVFMLAGVPGIMRAQLEGLEGSIEGGAVVHSGAVTMLAAESRIAPELQRIEDKYPDVLIGSYPFFRSGNIGTTLIVRSAEEEQIETALEDIRGAIKKLGAELVEGDLAKTLA